MATPKGTQNVSTPRNPHVSTPSRLTASPRHNTGTFASKSLAYKSPASKTPASLQSHSHRISTSSHPISTPLAAPAIHDELLNLNSPAAALIASIGNAGLTPIASGQDGLGITSGIPSHSVGGVSIPPKNPELEKLNRLQQVARLLKSKTAGRGVTREGVERIAQIYSFTILWDEDNLTIAGNRVDLEITFDGATRDMVRDVQLRLNIAGSDEPQLQKDASKILYKHLTESDGRDYSKEAWDSLKAFSHDLEYLSQLDYLDSSANPFDLVADLYATFHRVWDEESKRIENRPEINRICQSNAGRPSIDSYDQLGITTRYWIEKQTYTVMTKKADELSLADEATWKATFYCEKGSPGIAASHEWLEKEPLTHAVTTEDVFQERVMDKPNWSVASLSDVAIEQQKDADAMILDDAAHGTPGNLDLVFTCRLAPEVMLPVNVANELNSQFAMLEIDQSKAVPYQQALRSQSKSLLDLEWHSGLHWTKSASFYDINGFSSSKNHAYSLYISGVLWSVPVDSLRFSHPKQYVDALPVLRQYALLWSLLRNTIVGGEMPPKNRVDSIARSASKEPAGRNAAWKRSNKKPVQIELEDILAMAKPLDTPTKVDLTMDLLSDTTKSKLEIFVPVPAEAARRGDRGFVHVIIEVRRDGILDILAIHGPHPLEEEKLRRKAVKVLGLTEDLAMLVEWLLSEVRTAG